MLPRTRAYRMRIDEWALRKYKPREDVPEAGESITAEHKPKPNIKLGSIEGSLPPEPPPNSQMMPTEFVTMSPSGYQPDQTTDFNGLQSTSHLTIQEGPMEATEVLALIERSSEPFHALEYLLVKWKAGGSYLNALRILLKNPSNCQSITRCTYTDQPFLFALIETHVTPDEQIEAGKLLLDTLLLSDHTKDPRIPVWLKLWNNACRCTDWEEVQNVLHDGNIVSHQAGEIFLTAALVVLAEHILRRIHKRLRAFSTPNGWDNEAQRTETSQLRRKYLYILEECRDGNLNLRPSLYKQSLEVIERDESNADDQRTSRHLTLADGCRHKYLEMTDGTMGCYNGFDETARDAEDKEWFDTPNAIVLNSEHLEEPLPSIESDSPTPSFSPAPHDSWINIASQSLPTPAADPVSSAQTVVVNLMESFKSLRGFKSQVRSILERNLTEIFLFDRKSQSPPQENLFDLIVRYVPQSDQNSLIKAILVACSTIRSQQPDHTLAWFLQLFHSKTWTNYQNLTQQSYIDEYLTPIMSPEATKQVIDATTLLVGERMLRGLKIILVRNPGSTARGRDMELYQDTNKNYMAILVQFQTRGLKFDQSWLSFYLNTM